MIRTVRSFCARNLSSRAGAGWRLKVRLERAAAFFRCALFGVTNPETLFDREFYLSQYQDVSRSGMDPLFHYLWFGAAEGRQPHPFFDGAYYLAEYPDVAASGANPMLHFLRAGGLERRRPHPLFDSAFYVSRYADVAEAGINPLVHFLLAGCKEGRLPCEDFNPAEYLAANPDVAQAGMDAVVHFATRGMIEQRALWRPWNLIDSADLLPVETPAAPLSHPPVVDVIVPIYRGLAETKACLESIEAATNVLSFRVIFINDASPEPELTAWLREQASAGRIELLENERNQGFVRTVNRGMSLSSNDIVLLNSDTLVFNNWLDRLARCAHSADRIGTVTPFSNNAIICSYPEFCKDNAIPEGLNLGALDSDFARVNSGRNVDLPTAVGFCMYIRRDCYAEVGEFDAATFGIGYGEENDFCMRAAQRKWRNVLACDVFVYHAGAVSFGTNSGRQDAAMKALLRKHPRYLQLVRSHVRQDPSMPYRVAVAAWRIRESGKKVFLIVSHSLGGGVAQHISQLKKDTRGEVIWLELQPSGGNYSLSCDDSLFKFSASFDALQCRHQVLTVLRAAGVQRIQVHHVMGFSRGIESLVMELKVPFDFTVHDYFAICPHVNLTDCDGSYCGEPDTAGCDSCIASRPIRDGITDIVSWRQAQSWLLNADRVIAPSGDAAERMRKYYPEANIGVVAHKQGYATQPRPPALNGSEPLRIAVLGTMTAHKGFSTLQECAEIASQRSLPLEYTLIGKLEDVFRGDKLCFSETGAYELKDLPHLIRRSAPHLVWFPAHWPETFSYTLSTCLELGLPVAVRELGAFPERVAGRSWSWVLPETTSPEVWTEFFLSIREMHFRTGQPPVPPPPKPQAAAANHHGSVACLSTALKRVGRRADHRRADVAAVVSADASSGQLQACAYVRVVCPLTHPCLDDVVRLNLINTSALMNAFSRDRLQSETIIVQRAAVSDPRNAESILEHCHKYGTRLIYETDDDLLSIGPDHVEYAAYKEPQKAVRLLASEAHFVTASTPHLRSKLLEVNPRTILIPNYLDERLWPLETDRRDKSTTIRFVYAGTSTHRNDLQLLRDVMRSLRERLENRVQLDVIGVSEGRQEDWFEAIPVPPVVASSYPRFAAWFREQAVRSGWHWGLAPLLDTPFNRSKSAIKVLEYAAAGIPTICSDVPPYSEFISHGRNGLLTSNENQSWFRTLLLAAEDTACQERVYAGARVLLSDNTLAVNAERLRTTWNTLTGAGPERRFEFPSAPGGARLETTVYESPDRV